MGAVGAISGQSGRFSHLRSAVNTRFTLGDGGEDESGGGEDGEGGHTVEVAHGTSAQ